MSLDVLRPEDVPKGPWKIVKDYDRCLVTSDLPRAQPTLAHPSSGSGIPVPFKYLDKPPLADIAKTRTHYPPIGASRPRDLSLTSADIDGATPSRSGANSEGHQRGYLLHPLQPVYQFAASDALRQPASRFSGRNATDVSDIEGAGPSPAMPVRNQYVDIMRSDFHSPGLDRSLADALARGQGRSPPDTTFPVPRADASTPRDSRRPPPRHGDPLEPRYSVFMPRDGAPTSLHCCFAEERKVHVDPPSVVSSEIGPVEGSRPRSSIRKGEPPRKPETSDVEGAASLRRIGRLPYNMYGPAGNRPSQSASLDTSTVPGAQAGTLCRGPKTQLRGARLTGAAVVGLVGTPRASGVVPMSSTEMPDADAADVMALEAGSTMRPLGTWDEQQ